MPMPNPEDHDEEREGRSRRTHRQAARVRVVQFARDDETGELLEVSIFIVDHETKEIEHVATKRWEYSEEEGEDACGARSLLEEEALEALMAEPNRCPVKHANNQTVTDLRPECPWCNPEGDLEDEARDYAETN